MDDTALLDARVQLRGAAGAERRRGEDRREGERGRGDACGEHARKEREGIGHAAGTGAGGDEGVEEGRRERWARARAPHSVEREGGGRGMGEDGEMCGTGNWKLNRTAWSGPLSEVEN